MLDYRSLKLRLPDSYSFADLRSANKIYVDKTAIIYDLAFDRTPHFLSRPRRFGKSTIVSVLEELFTHGVDDYDGHPSYFKGLAIEKLWTEKGGQYVVLRLNFYSIKTTCNTAAEFKQYFLEVLNEYAQKYELTVNARNDNPIVFLEALIQACGRGKAILLIDEYDCLFNQFIDEQKFDDLNEIVKFMRALFGVIKDNTEYLRCAFITGITRFKDSSMLTEGNTIVDISLDTDFSTICGLTEAELKQYFRDHLIYAATNYFQCQQNEVTEALIDELIAKLAYWYDGYCFDELGEKRVFSIWSILNFFMKRRTSFINYWFESAGTPSVLLRNLNRVNAFIASEDFSFDKVEVRRSDFLSPNSLVDMDPYVALFQTGYLTLKEGFLDKGLAEPIVLKLPNYELKQSLESLLSLRIFNFKNKTSPDTAAFHKILLAQDVEKLAEFFSLILAGVDYEGSPISSEANAASLIQTYLTGMQQNVVSNLHQNSGRCDSVITYEDAVTLAIEYKYTKSDSDAELDRKLEEALAQIKDRDYAHTISTRTKLLWRVALVYSSKLHRFARAQTSDILKLHD